jgi:ABC-2 type transport system ATP-binding protein
MPQNILEVSNLTKKFKNVIAVSNISFSVGEGEIIGLLGPNGAGKTTTIQMLLGLMNPTSGEISYFGQDLHRHRQEILQKINYSSAYAKLPWRLTVWENLHVYAWLYQIQDKKKKIMELCDRFEATSLLKMQFKDLSAGQITRVLLVKAFLNDPEMVLLDEPTASLDPDIADKIRQYILEERERRKLTILITSHNMGEVEELCDRVIFLSHGKILAIDTPEGLARRNKDCYLELMVIDGLKRLIEIALKNNLKFVEKKRFITITLKEEMMAQFLTEIGKKGVEFSEIEIIRPNLEDFFLKEANKL